MSSSSQSDFNLSFTSPPSASLGLSSDESSGYRALAAEGATDASRSATSSADSSTLQGASSRRVFSTLVAGALAGTPGFCYAVPDGAAGGAAAGATFVALTYAATTAALHRSALEALALLQLHLLNAAVAAAVFALALGALL